jgi:hypothetical protein
MRDSSMAASRMIHLGKQWTTADCGSSKTPASMVVDMVVVRAGNASAAVAEAF